MPTIREITTQWTTPAGNTFFTVMYFLGGVSVASQRTALQAFWNAIKAAQDGNASWFIANVGKEVDDSTGNLLGTWLDASSKVGTGAGSSGLVPDASQGLIRWRSEDIINNRFVRGRTFVPGLSLNAVTTGNLGASTIGTLQTAANALISSAAGLVIWHRPIAGSGGSAHTATTASIWNELAVLRRRRK